MLNENELANGVVVSTRIRFARNVTNLPFPNKTISQKDSENFFNQVYSVVGKMGKFNIFKMANMTPIEMRALMEKYLISSNLIGKKNAAAIVNPEETISIMLNEEDHIRAQCVQKGFKLNEAYSVLDKIDDALGEKLSIAFDKELGFLTACPTNLGTGMRASVMLFLPCITIGNRIRSIMNALGKMGITFRGVYGEGSETAGYLYQISNQMSLGMTEADILKNVESAVLKLIEAEVAFRANLLNRDKLNVKDRVMRAYGILTNCVKLDTNEFMKLISDVKLGVYLNLISLKDATVIDDLIIKAQPANITLSARKDLTATERDVFRAEYVGKNLRQLFDEQKK